jgi:hypothetical protein
MVAEQKFKSRVADSGYLIRVGVEVKRVNGHCGAGGHDLTGIEIFHYANAAATSGMQSHLITERRYVNACSGGN